MMSKKRLFSFGEGGGAINYQSTRERERDREREKRRIGKVRKGKGRLGRKG